MSKVLEQAKEKMIGIGQQDLALKVDAMHKILKTKLNGGNITIAKQAEEFLNWLVFEKGNLMETPSLDDAYRNELLQNNPTINNIKLKFKEQSLKSKEYNIRLSEKISTEAFKELQRDYGAFAQQRGVDTEEMLIELVNNLVNEKTIMSTGTESATVVVNKWSKKLLENTGLYGEKEIKKLVQDGKNIRYIGRSMKSDAQGGNIQYTIKILEPAEYIKACLEVFSDVSIKSVNNIEKIHLEEVDINKAYTAFMRFAYSNKYLTQKVIKNIFNTYYGAGGDKNEDYEYVTRHLNHLFRVYAYSGFGTSPINDLNNISKGVKYLVVVDNLQQYIYVKSSTEVIDFLMTYNNKTLQPDVALNLKSLLNKI